MDKRCVVIGLEDGELSFLVCGESEINATKRKFDEVFWSGFGEDFMRAMSLLMLG